MKRRSRYRNKRFIRIGLVGMLVLNLLTGRVYAQNDSIVPLIETSAPDTFESRLEFVVDSLVRIEDPNKQLEPVFRTLSALKSGKDTVLTILHLGDSHIQAGYYSGQTMRLLQQEFGNAGRGWVAPFKLTRTNEPDDYFIRSAAKEWTAGRITQRQKRTPIGPGGIGIRSVSTSINFDLTIAPINGAGYWFNQAVLYRGDRSTPMLPAGPMKDSVSTSRSAGTLAPRLMTDTFRITKQTDLLQLHSTRRKPGTDVLIPASEFSNIYYGFNLTNGQPGVLYHSVGVNGAMFVQYTDADFLQRVALLKPDLLIVSLGTNESFGSRFSEAEFSSQIRAFLQMVKQYMPHTAILLTTPAECYKRVSVNKKRTYVQNLNSQKAASAIVKLAKQEGLACWDLFRATGGKNSYQDWYRGGYFGRDRIHFTKSGYQKQGALLFQALMRTLAEEETNDVELAN